jgi:hypothetical protein
MAQPREASSHILAYLQGNPTSQLFTWVTKAMSNNNYQDPSSRRDGSETIDEASSGTSSATKGAPGEEYHVELQRSERKAEPRQKRHNEAHDWTLTRRIAVASTICLYT